MIKNYTLFIKEYATFSKVKIKVPLVISDSIKLILGRIEDEISNRLLEETEEDAEYEISYIDKTEKNDTVTFIAASKVDKNDLNSSWGKPKSEIKIGRMIKKLYGDDFDEKQIENFVNRFKALYDSKWEDDFKLIKGDNILRYYLEENYESDYGSLGGSCMKYEEKNKFMELYSNNDEHVSMLILKGKNYTIRGRAIVWDLKTPENRIYMDRIYTNNDSEVVLFKEYAKSKGWLYRKNQSCQDQMTIMDGTSQLNKFKLSVIIKKSSNEYYPYMDTFKYLEKIGGGKILLTNYVTTTTCYALEGTEGDDFTEIMDDDIVELYDGEYCLERDSVRVDDIWVRDDDPNLFYLDYLGTYVLMNIGDKKIVNSKFDDCKYLEEDCYKVWMDKEQTKFKWIWKDNPKLNKVTFKEGSDYYHNNLKEDSIDVYITPNIVETWPNKEDTIKINNKYYDVKLFSDTDLNYYSTFDKKDPVFPKVGDTIYKVQKFSPHTYCRYGCNSRDMPLKSKGTVVSVYYNENNNSLCVSFRNVLNNWTNWTLDIRETSLRDPNEV